MFLCKTWSKPIFVPNIMFFNAWYIKMEQRSWTFNVPTTKTETEVKNVEWAVVNTQTWGSIKHGQNHGELESKASARPMIVQSQAAVEAKAPPPDW